MLENALWQKLKALVDIDKQISNLDKEIISTKKLLIDLNNQIITNKQKLEDRKKFALQAKKQLDTLELQTKSIESEEAAKKIALDKIKTQKEYRSLENELAHISRERMNLENQVTQLWFKHEEMQNNNISEECKLKQNLEQLEKEIAGQEELITQNTNKKNEYSHKRNDVAAKIPSEWLNKYERMKNSVDDPIVPISNDCCGACYYSILRQDLSRIKHAGVLPCRNCYRFLYYNDEEQQDLAKAQF